MAPSIEHISKLALSIVAQNAYSSSLEDEDGLTLSSVSSNDVYLASPGRKLPVLRRLSLSITLVNLLLN